MRISLALISLLYLSYSIPCFGNKKVECALSEKDSVISKEYSLITQIRGQEITGICLINISLGTGVVGTVINEMGVKAFDFSYSNGKVNIFNIVNPLNKWYIRKILKKDFWFILSNLDETGYFKDAVWKNRTLVQTSDNKIVVDDNRYKITYTFIPMRRITENNEYN